MSPISGVYRILNTVTGKSYIGRSVNIELRWAQHKIDAKKGSPFPIHCSLRKHGVDAFVFSILDRDCAINLPALELEYILKFQAYDRKKGYNLGGTKSGFPSKSEIATMPEVLRLKWKKMYLVAGKLGHDKVTELRANPEYEKLYLEVKSNASKTREKNIAVHRVIDPVFDEKIKSLRSKATQHRVEGYQTLVGIEFTRRFLTDASYRERISNNRQRANIASGLVKNKWNWFDNAIAQHMHKNGAKLKEVALEVGKTVSWACLALQKESHYAFVP
jgi:group I intron endonuclease